MLLLEMNNEGLSRLYATCALSVDSWNFLMDVIGRDKIGTRFELEI